MATDRRPGLVLAAALVLLAAFSVRAEPVHREVDGKRVIPLSINVPLAARFPFLSTSPLDRGFRYPGGGHLLYAIPVRPGAVYSLGLVLPAFQPGVAVTLFDRWPWAPGARRIHLPFPALGGATGPLELFWRFGISRRSPGSFIYAVLETSSPLDRDRGFLPHTIFVNSPVVQRPAGRGVYLLEGPQEFLAVGDDYAGQPADDGASVGVAPDGQWIPPELLNRPLPGDLLRNGRFQQGLLHWEPSAAVDDPTSTAMVAVTAEGLRLWSDQGRGHVRVSQTLAEEVREASALFLRARVKVTGQTSPGLGSGREAPVAISVCYDDVDGVSRCGKDAFWQGFYIHDAAEGEPPAEGRKVAPGLWVDYVADLAALNPRPAIIKSIAIDGAGWPEWEGWVKEVHLLHRRDDDS